VTLWPSSWKIDMPSLLRRRSSIFYQIWDVNAKSHANDGEKVNVETGSIISTWQSFVFRNRK